MHEQPVVALVSLGCAKNLVDSEQLASILADAGVRVVADPAEATVAVVNTCGFISSAKEESIDTVLEVADEKKRALQTLIVTGCLTQRYGEELRALMPEVDSLVGTDPQETARLVLEALGLTPSTPPCGPALRSRRLTPRAWGYLRISEGCDNRCAYCAIPIIRGPHRSVPMDALLAEARALCESGVRELNIIAQDSTAYGMDLGAPALPALLRELCAVDGLEWLRLLYAHPAHTTQELLDTMASEPKMCHYLDMPLQHINDRILGEMGRKVDRATIERVLAAARRTMPDVTLRTTFLVGFPGETEAEFDELIHFMRDTRFDRLGAFAFSPEEDTRAAVMPNQIADEERELRCDAIMLEQQSIAFELAEERIGQRVQVLVEGLDAESALWQTRGRSEAPDVDPLVLVETEEDLESGAFIQVEIVAADGYDCIAELAAEDTQ
jgi:ribosomal protein S12 methylthiotransferase